jgi:hypothetical protein
MSNLDITKFVIDGKLLHVNTDDADAYVALGLKTLEECFLLEADALEWEESAGPITPSGPYILQPILENSEEDGTSITGWVLHHEDFGRLGAFDTLEEGQDAAAGVASELLPAVGAFNSSDSYLDEDGETLILAFDAPTRLLEAWSGAISLELALPDLEVEGTPVVLAESSTSIVDGQLLIELTLASPASPGDTITLPDGIVVATWIDASGNRSGPVSAAAEITNNTV